MSSAVVSALTDTILFKRLLCPLSNFRVQGAKMVVKSTTVVTDAATAPEHRAGSDEENDEPTAALMDREPSPTPPRLDVSAVVPPCPPAVSSAAVRSSPPACVSPRAPMAISPRVSTRPRTRSCLACSRGSARRRAVRSVSFASDDDTQCEVVLGSAQAGVDRTSIQTTAVASQEWEQLGGDWKKPDASRLQLANDTWCVAQPLIAPPDADAATRYVEEAPTAPHDFVHVQWSMYVLMPARGGWVPCTAVRYSASRRRVWVHEQAAEPKPASGASAAAAAQPSEVEVLLQSTTCRLMECSEAGGDTIAVFERLQLQIFEEVNGQPNSAAAAAAGSGGRKRRSLTYPLPSGGPGLGLGSEAEQAALMAVKRAKLLEAEARAAIATE